MVYKIILLFVLSSDYYVFDKEFVITFLKTSKK